MIVATNARNIAQPHRLRPCGASSGSNHRLVATLSEARNVNLDARKRSRRTFSMWGMDNVQVDARGASRITLRDRRPRRARLAPGTTKALRSQGFREIAGAGFEPATFGL